MIRTFLKKRKHLDQVLRQRALRRREEMSPAGSAGVLALPPRRNVSGGAVESRTWRGVWWGSGLAAAASLLLMLSPGWFRPTPPVVNAGEFSQQLTTVPGEVLRLLNAAAETSQTRLPRMSPLANLSVPDLPAWQGVSLRLESPMQEELDAWQESWRHLKSRWPGQEF